MKVVYWTDDAGRRQRSLVPDGVSDPRLGLPDGPPNLDGLDWEAVRRDLHNALAERGLWAWPDVVAAQNALNGAILAVLHHRLAALYKNEASARLTDGDSSGGDAVARRR